MAGTVEKEIGRFIAEDDDGVAHHMIEYQQYELYTAPRQATETIEGGKRFMLDDGSPVQDMEDGTFKIIETGKIIRKV